MRILMGMMKMIPIKSCKGSNQGFVIIPFKKMTYLVTYFSEIAVQQPAHRMHVISFYLIPVKTFYRKIVTAPILCGAFFE